ncbi:MAG: diguanylate cyclase [Gammaproteobacteria bacterium]
MEDTIFNENQALRRKLDNLLRQARTNEKKQGLFDSLGFEIIGSSNPGDLRDMLLIQMPARFQLQDVVLCVVDFEKDSECLFFCHNEEAKQIFGHKLKILDPENELDKIQTLKHFPQLGEKVLQNYSWLLDNLENPQLCQSAALLPLIRSDRIIGALMLISSDVNRYQSSHGTEFLQKLSAMTAVAIENCLNQQRLKEIGYQDALTQAYNRRYFDLRFKDEIERCLRNKEDLGCMFLDVDFFKKVNDTYGHHIGDLVLIRMVSIIKEQVRACDVVARYGGEEFVVVLPSADIDTARDIAERLRINVHKENHVFYEHKLNISISIGLTTLKSLEITQGMGSEELGKLLLDHADQALYSAKENGRNQVVIYSD